MNDEEQTTPVAPADTETAAGELPQPSAPMAEAAEPASPDQEEGEATTAKDQIQHLLELAQAYEDRGEIAESLTALNEVLRLGPDHVEGLAGRAWLFSQNGRKEDARAVIDHLMAVYGENA